MTSVQRHRAAFDGALNAVVSLAPDGSRGTADDAVEWLAREAREVRRASGSVFFVGVGAGDPQSHHFAAAFYRRLGIRGIALGESPFRTGSGDPARAAEVLAHWFAKPRDIVVHLLDSTPLDRARILLEGAADLGLRTVAFARGGDAMPLSAVGQLSVFIPSDDPCVCDTVQHFVVNAWIAAVGRTP